MSVQICKREYNDIKCCKIEQSNGNLIMLFVVIAPSTEALNLIGERDILGVWNYLSGAESLMK